ncbi:MAG TPA: hypothetical protein EYP41_16640, partial [Anaerolineae bacterium]|nr:hypothetical protein [Anaerolineae bacterium]
YFCTGAMHAPHHVPREWADAYKGTPGRAQLYVDGKLAGQAKFPHTTRLSLGSRTARPKCAVLWLSSDIKNQGAVFKM